MASSGLESERKGLFELQYNLWRELDRWMVQYVELERNKIDGGFLLWKLLISLILPTLSICAAFSFRSRVLSDQICDLYILITFVLFYCSKKGYGSLVNESSFHSFHNATFRATVLNVLRALHSR